MKTIFFISQAMMKVSKNSHHRRIPRPFTYVIGTSMVGSILMDGRPTLMLPISLSMLFPSALAELPLLVKVSMCVPK
jgi:hypothetical protein